MAFEWATGNAYAMIATVYANNFTLNTIAANYLESYKYCMLGLDSINNKVAIKPVSKEEIDLGLVSKDNLHKISIGKGYARISNKSFIDNIFNNYQNINYGTKLVTSFYEKDKLLIIDLNAKI